MPKRLQVGDESRGAASLLLASLPALGALLAGLAVTGNLVGRMARNHPLATFGTFGCTVLAVSLGGIAAYGLGEGSRHERRVVRAGLVVLALALLLGVLAAVETWGDRTEPSITVTPRSGSVVTVTVSGTGLRSSDHLVVEVEQLLRGVDDQGKPAWTPGQPLYGASLGPDASGEIKHSVNLTLPAGDFDDLGARAWIGTEPRPCYGRGNTTGCVRVHIPRPQERPQLAVTWETYVRVPRLLVTLKAKNLAPSPRRWMILRVYGLGAGQPTRALAAWRLAPDADGNFARRVAVVVGHGYSDVCIVATLAAVEPHCPAGNDDETVWAQLAVPALH
jgi:hypothetical protein